MDDNIFENYVKNNLSIGMIIKNYKIMCKLFNEDVKCGNSKIIQINNWSRFFKWHNDGQKYIIDEIYKIPINKIDNRKFTKGNRRKEFSNFLIPQEDENKIGIYKIILEDNIYIGSTTTSFRERFRGHRSKNSYMFYTYDMLDNGATFDVIEFCDGLSEIEIRNLENKYIRQYREDEDWNLINSRDAWDFVKKQKYKIIKVKVKEEDYESTLDILRNINLI